MRDSRRYYVTAVDDARHALMAPTAAHTDTTAERPRASPHYRCILIGAARGASRDGHHATIYAFDVAQQTKLFEPIASFHNVVAGVV